MRADAALVAQNLARSRSRAQELIAAGRVVADGRIVDKAAEPVADGTHLAVVLDSSDREYASRAGKKLMNAIAALSCTGAPLPIRGAYCVDLGASHGGFTDVLLRRQAAQVVAVDIGHDQLRPEIRADPRVSVRDGVNVRDLRQADLAQPADVVVADLAFISLTYVVGVIAELLRPGGIALVLVKPQFEVGRASVGDGVVRAGTLQAQAIGAVVQASLATGLRPWALIPAEPWGASGNREYFLALWAEAADARPPVQRATGFLTLAAAVKEAVWNWEPGKLGALLIEDEELAGAL